jgi:hypothetical protein
MTAPTEVIAERIGAHEAAACIALLKEAGWIVVRFDAIRNAQKQAYRQAIEDTNDGIQ